MKSSMTFISIILSVFFIGEHAVAKTELLGGRSLTPHLSQRSSVSGPIQPLTGQIAPRFQVDEFYALAPVWECDFTGRRPVCCWEDWDSMQSICR